MLFQTQIIVIHAVQMQNHADSFKDPVTKMIPNVLMVSNVEMTTVWDPPMLTLSLALILIAVIRVCQSKKSMEISTDGNANANAEMKFFFFYSF